MPLFDVASNVQQTETAARKRSHAEFADATVHLPTDESLTLENLGLPKDFITSASMAGLPTRQTSPIPIITMPAQSPPSSSSPAAMTEAGSSTPDKNSFSPNPTSSKSSGLQKSPSPNQQHPTAPAVQPSSTTTMSASTTNQIQAGVKRRHKAVKTAAEKAQEEQERAEKRRKKAEVDAEREAAKAEKEAARLEREAAKRERDAAKAAEKAKADAEKEKKAKQQPSLRAFFIKPKQVDVGPTTPVKQTSGNTAKDRTTDDVANASPDLAKKDRKTNMSEYERRFKPFYVKQDVTMAGPSSFSMDEETKQAKSDILDKYICGERGEVSVTPFEPVNAFQLNGLHTRRGILHFSVAKIMSEMYGDPVDNRLGVPPIRTESQMVRYNSVQEQLDAIPIKILSFYEDVRPPYVGTVTSNMDCTLHKLARRPTGRVLKLNYDYDSEAEWEEEEGEDLDDCEEEDDDNEVDEEMADFLDDADDAATARPGFLRESSPKSTGICFENAKRLGPQPAAYKYRMEFLLEPLQDHSMIDPFSTEYWQPKPSASRAAAAAALQQPPALPTSAPMGPPAAPSDAFARLAASAAGSASTTDVKDIVPKQILDEFKRAVISDDINFLTKVGIVDMLAKRFPLCTRAQVKNTIEKIAERVPVPGGRKSDKRWVLLPEFAL
ncbi:chromatin assembly factor 1 subunit A-domain-containing protein [Pseudomassariella vexata]|uniref:Chromatin assembly factor 1 subunit A-domain-containing protein n=1 Tax=Pseudomassariella vexata TaxID=1141098 RepID=A0A1Y2EK65_9PEZI|nr:chromatin assembly factor 1 subunit A-domain-containing protein [Pseudomassariella vexata]ORY71674.1 chromatin assembly factor 1 subunit A-domain-containing protein [Pseudomassariella vexata]